MFLLVLIFHVKILPNFCIFSFISGLTSLFCRQLEPVYIPVILPYV